jgi:hypothetical protein
MTTEAAHPRCSGSDWRDRRRCRPSHIAVSCLELDGLRCRCGCGLCGGRRRILEGRAKASKGSSRPHILIGRFANPRDPPQRNSDHMVGLLLWLAVEKREYVYGFLRAETKDGCGGTEIATVYLQQVKICHFGIVGDDVPRARKLGRARGEEAQGLRWLRRGGPRQWEWGRGPMPG